MSLRNIFAIRSTIIIYLNDWRMEREEDVELVNRTLTRKCLKMYLADVVVLYLQVLSAIQPLKWRNIRRENVEKISKSDTRRYITL